MTAVEREPICSACLTEACAAGILMCEDARRAAIILRQRAGFVRAYECGTSEPAAPSRAAGELSQVGGGGSGI